jgi:hypothetical protein
VTACLKRSCIACGWALLIAACGGGTDGSGGTLGGAGTICTKSSECMGGLVCAYQVCRQAGADCPEDRDCSGLVCGPDPVCGLICGMCDVGQSCQGGECVACDASCGKPCGDDECSGGCDECGGDEKCECGLCVGEVAAGSTWTDPGSGLSWQVTPTGFVMDWGSAKGHCASLELDGDGWRLPTVSELRTLIRGCPATEDGGSCVVTDDCLSPDCRNLPACDGCSGADGPTDGCYWPKDMQGACGTYWSSSSTEYDVLAWCVSFESGRVAFFLRDLSPADPEGDGYPDLAVRCVR